MLMCLLFYYIDNVDNVDNVEDVDDVDDVYVIVFDFVRLLQLCQIQCTMYNCLKTYSGVFFAHPIAQVFRSLNLQGVWVRIPTVK